MAKIKYRPVYLIFEDLAHVRRWAAWSSEILARRRHKMSARKVKPPRPKRITNPETVWEWEHPTMGTQYFARTSAQGDVAASSVYMGVSIKRPGEAQAYWGGIMPVNVPGEPPVMTAVDLAPRVPMMRRVANTIKNNKGKTAAVVAVLGTLGTWAAHLLGAF